MQTATRKTVAEICFYGTSAIGAGWLATVVKAKQMLGTGEPHCMRSFTDALWQACDAIRAAGVKRGQVTVYAPGGQQMATIDVQRPPYYADLRWKPAPQLVFSLETLLSAATDPR